MKHKPDYGSVTAKRIHDLETMISAYGTRLEKLKQELSARDQFFNKAQSDERAFEVAAIQQRIDHAFERIVGLEEFRRELALLLDKFI